MSSFTPYLWIALLLLGGCMPNEPEDRVIALVGDASITTMEFERDFEQGFPDLKEGPDPTLAYLERMIAEQLLAQEGYRIGLDSTAVVRRKVESLTKELLVERVFEEDAARSVSVTPAEIDSLRRLDAIQISLRFLPASNLESAKRLRQQYIEEGFSSAVADLSTSEGWMRGLRPSDLETNSVSPASLDPVVWEAIRNLPVGEVSLPVSFRGAFLLVEVLDIFRTPIAAEPGQEEMARYQQVAYTEKARIAARALIKRTVVDSDLRIKGATYGSLEQALWDWLSSETQQGQEGVLTLAHRLETDLTLEAEVVRNLQTQTILETVDRSWTVEEFLAEYPHDRYSLSLRSYDEFRSDLYDAFGLLVRDRLFVRKAVAEGYDQASDLADEVKRWTDKWVYEVYRDHVADTVAVRDEDVSLYFERHRSNWPEDVTLEAVRSEVEHQVRRAKTVAALERVLIDLRGQTRIEIDYGALGQFDVSALGSRSPSVQLFKASTGRPAWPVTDYGL